MTSISQARHQRMPAAIATLPEPTRAIYLADLLQDLDYRTIGAREGLRVREVERPVADALVLIDRHLRSSEQDPE